MPLFRLSTAAMWRSTFAIKSLVRGVTKRTPTFRQATTSSGYRDPGYMVNAETMIDSDLIKVPLMTDKTRKDLFKKFKDDPEKWTIPALSNTFNCSVERVKAIIFLLQGREDLMIADGVFDIKNEWKLMVAKVEEDSVLNTPETLAEEYEMTPEEVKIILAKMKIHNQRYG